MSGVKVQYYGSNVYSFDPESRFLIDESPWVSPLPGLNKNGEGNGPCLNDESVVDDLDNLLKSTTEF